MTLVTNHDTTIHGWSSKYPGHTMDQWLSFKHSWPASPNLKWNNHQFISVLAIQYEYMYTYIYINVCIYIYEYPFGIPCLSRSNYHCGMVHFSFKSINHHMVSELSSQVRFPAICNRAGNQKHHPSCRPWGQQFSTDLPERCDYLSGIWTLYNDTPSWTRHKNSATVLLLEGPLTIYYSYIL